MRTPRMKEILKQTYPGVINLREYAGYSGSRKTEWTRSLREASPLNLVEFSQFRKTL